MYTKEHSQCGHSQYVSPEVWIAHDTDAASGKSLDTGSSGRSWNMKLWADVGSPQLHIPEP